MNVQKKKPFSGLLYRIWITMINSPPVPEGESVKRGVPLPHAFPGQATDFVGVGPADGDIPDLYIDYAGLAAGSRLHLRWAATIGGEAGSGHRPRGNRS